MISTNSMRSQDGQQAAGLPRPKNNASSSQLTPEENEAVFRLLGRKCQTLNTAVVQIYKTEGNAHSHWKKKHTGVLCFVKDSAIRSYFMRAYCLIKNELIWEHEIYEGMQVFRSRPFLLTFEGNDGNVGLNFMLEDECDSFFSTVAATIETRNRKRQEKRSRQKSEQAPNVPLQSAAREPVRPASIQGREALPPSSVDTNAVQLRNNKFGSVTLTPAPAPAPTPAATKNFMTSTFGLSGSTGKDKKRKVTKADISQPMNFVHVSHVGWDANKGFDMMGNENDEMLVELFAKAGVSETQLKDRETRAFIYDFIQNHNVLTSVKQEETSSPTEPTPSEPPPVPSRHHPHHTQNGNQRTAPPPPVRQPPQVRQPPPPLPTTAPGAVRPPPPPSRPPPITTAPAAPPPPPVCPPAAAPPPPPPAPPAAAPPPPPPPPPMAPLEAPIEASTQSTVGKAAPAAPEVDSRSALMDAIRKGTALKPTAKPGATSGSNSSDPRNDLLGQIREGYALKPVNERKIPERTSDSSAGGTDALADALRRALAARGTVMHSDDEEDDTSSDNDWSE